MKTIGLIGGMSWESTAEYYRVLNTLTKQRKGGLHSAKLIIHSVDFAEIERLQREGAWIEAGQKLAKIAKSLESAGADVILLATNTMHKVANNIVEAISVPFLHICDAVSHVIRAQGIETVGLLGTRYTMEQEFYTDRLRKNGLKIIVPDVTAREELNRIIFEELCLGKVIESSAAKVSLIADSLKQQGAKGLILGCTELGMLEKLTDFNTILFDTTQIHCKTAIDFALE